MKVGALGLRNRCNYDVNITFCTVGSDPSSFSYENRCEPGKVLPSRLVRAGEWSGSQMQGAGVNWVACAAPSAPVQTRFNAGKIEAQCSRL